MRADVVGQFFDNKVGHVRAHLLGEQYMTTKSLISIGKQYILTVKLRMQELVKRYGYYANTYSE